MEFKEEDYTPQQAQNEYLELLVKAARRCAYDLAHAADSIPRHDEFHKVFTERAYMWQKVFTPGDDGKNYRHRLHGVIGDLERKIEKLRKRCEDNNIDISDLRLDNDWF
jgi:hypothetical protein